MKLNVKNVVKFAGVVCAATGVVALSSVVASGAAVAAVKEGFKSAKETMRKLLEENEQEPEAVKEPFAVETESEPQKKTED